MSRRKRTIAAAKGGRRKQKVARPRRGNQRSRALDVALAGLAHEVRTPLNGILALGELLAASDLPVRERGWAADRWAGERHPPLGRLCFQPLWTAVAVLATCSKTARYIGEAFW